jgi:hypothetical protein
VREPGQPDCFEVVNGPEDGATFPIVRGPFHIGSDPLNAVHISLDDDVAANQALVSVVSDGYRVRRVGRAPVYVDGRSAGYVRSRVVRDGGVVRVGNTELMLAAAPDGLARRSRGAVGQSDAAYAVQQTGRLAVRVARGVLSLGGYLLAQLLSHWWLVLAILVAMYFTWPAFHWQVRGYLNAIYDFVVSRGR